MAKFIQVNQWDHKYEKADKIVVNTEQIVQVNPTATESSHHPHSSGRIHR
jgi:hypothetical protein